MKITDFDPAIDDLVIAKRKEIVFIENDVGDYHAIAAQVGAGRDVVILDATRDGLRQMADYLHEHSGVNALHVITHGAEGKLDLGALTLDSTTATERASLLASIGNSLAPHADILLYGCDVAAGKGASFVDQLAIATGADVAASSNPTGAANLGGDWNLEVTHGDIETAPVVDAALAAQYKELLAITNTTIGFDDGKTPRTLGSNGAGVDLVYHISGNYDLHFDGNKNGVGSYGYDSLPPSAYIVFSPSESEDQVTIEFTNRALFTPTGVDLNSNASVDQWLTLTGKNAQGGVINSKDFFVPAGQHIEDFTHVVLSGFNDISSLVITEKDGGTINYFQMDNLVLSDAHVAPPAVSSVSSGVGSYNAQKDVYIYVNFDDEVDVTGTPRLQLETGTTDRYAVYSSGSGSSTLKFTYTVQAGDSTGHLDYLDTTALSLNGGTIKSATSGKDAVLTLYAPGDVGSLGLNSNIVIDTTAPNAPPFPVLLPASDSGTKGDGITNDTTPTFTGTVDNDVTKVELWDGGTTLLTQNVSGGTYSITVATPLTGDHAFMVAAIDAAGNRSELSAGTPITIDTTAPTATVANALLSDDTGPDTTDLVTSKASQVLSGTLSANLKADEQVLVSLDGANWSVATTQAGANTWSLPVTLAGSGTLQVKVVDLAGNDGTAYTHAYTLDKTAPAAPSAPKLTAGSDTGLSNSDNVTGAQNPVFSGTAEPNAAITLYEGSKVVGSGKAGANGAWNVAATLDAGEHTITAKATDLAGNEGAASAPSPTITVIFGGPSTAIASVALSADSGTPHDFVTNEASQTISGTLDAALATGQRVQVSLDGGDHWVNATAAVGSTSWQLGATTLLAGSHELWVRVADDVDNSGPVAKRTYTLDQVGPSVSIASNAAMLKAGGTATITFTFSEDPGGSFTWGGSSGDVVVDGGKLSPISGSGLTRTATFTPTANVDSGTASIKVNAGSYADLAGNINSGSASLAFAYDTKVPDAPTALDLDNDSGAIDTDNLTSAKSLVIKGSAEAGSTVRLYDSDGSNEVEIGHATATGGNWTITTVDLLDGEHNIVARAMDGAGNRSDASGPLKVTVDSIKPAAVQVGLAAGSDSGALGDGITKVAKPTFSGSAEAFAEVTLYKDGAVLGTTTADQQGAWSYTPSAAFIDGGYVISARQTDRAGNQSDAGSPLNLSINTTGPAAPGAPQLAVDSDTGAVGDGVTENDRPTIQGMALPNAVVTLYDTAGQGGVVKLGSTQADASGKWSVTAPLSAGTHTLVATQSDVTGNESSAGASLTLRIDVPPEPVFVIDGMEVGIRPISLPGGIAGSAVAVPVVSSVRGDSSGLPGVADIPLVSADGANLLTAQLAPGYGLLASGGNAPNAKAADLLLAAIRTATPTHAGSDQGHLTANGQSFLDTLTPTGTLVVETITPVSGAKPPEGVLTLGGQPQVQGQGIALVIDAGALGGSGTLALHDVNFAAVIGSANVVSSGNKGAGMVLTGDAAGQHFTVVTDSGRNAVLAGGGDDVLTVNKAGGLAGSVTLHGGSAKDVAAFSGARADYDVNFHNGYVTVASKTGSQVASVVNVEQLQFSDGSVAVQNSADMGILAGIYQMALGRQADLGGIEFWANTHQAGVSWGAIALEFIKSSEHVAKDQGFNGVPAHDIELLYKALLDRMPDAAGLAYWTDAMAHGLSLEQIATNFVQSAEMAGHQRAPTDWDFILA